MKKILVVLLTLAVAGGVFAQGWSLEARAEIGTFIDFDPMFYNGTEWEPLMDSEGNKKSALVNGSGYHVPYSQYDGIAGVFKASYSNGTLNPFIQIEAVPAGFIWAGSSAVSGGITGNGENYTFVVEGNLSSIFNGANPGTGGQIWGPVFGRLWGEYKLLNDMVNLVVAFDGPDNEWYVSDKTGVFMGDVVANTFDFGGPVGGGRFFNGLFGSGDTFTAVDHHNFLLAGLNIGGLEMGLQIPGIFEINGSYPGRNTAGSYADYQTVVDTEGNYDGSGSNRFVDDVLAKSVFGAKFSMSPIEFAAQFRLDDYGIYFGGKFNISAVTVGLSFQGVLRHPVDEDRTMKFGGSVDYNGGAFGGGLKGWYRAYTPDIADAGTRYQVTAIEPYFFYNVIPTHLRFKLDAGFYFDTYYNGGDAEEQDIYWAVQPQLFWNFNGTGAGEYYGMNTGMIFRYRIVSARVNALDVTFRWGL